MAISSSQSPSAEPRACRPMQKHARAQVGAFWTPPHPAVLLELCTEPGARSRSDRQTGEHSGLERTVQVRRRCGSSEPDLFLNTASVRADTCCGLRHTGV
ncbi:hypothetical protein AALO_G00011980 [Alosa alosa]|uniref:Uncharacterized protein n=1 Tax=Alosa alosa TaxID=278164 RepID=A0AAV6HGH7_9TELE|nr:hypothetical protein AALO_G00011980 [Alosa alosa]